MGILLSPRAPMAKALLKDKVYHNTAFRIDSIFFQFSHANQTEISACDYQVSVLFGTSPKKLLFISFFFSYVKITLLN